MINRKFLLFPVLLIIMNVPVLKAQYEEIRFPRNEREISLIKSFNIKTETENSTETGQELVNAINYFDGEGRIIRSISPEAKRSFTYNTKGQLISRTDSVLTGRNFRVDKYSFEYDENGKIKSASLPVGNSVFQPGAASIFLNEILTGKDGKISYRTYRYDDAGKLREEIWKNADSTIQKTRKLYLNKKGLAVAEVLLENNNGKLDSTYIMRVFDANDDIVKKQYVKVVDYKNVATAKKESRTIVYTYDPKGNVTSETCTSTSVANSFKNEWSYTGAGYPKSRINYDGTGKQTRRFSYNYNFWNK